MTDETVNGQQSGVPAANWYPDPHQPGVLRWWDGSQWTDHTSPAPGTTAPPAASGTQQPQHAQGPQGRVYRLVISEVTGALILATRRTRVFQGSYEQCLAGYNGVLTHNLTLGWWSIIGFVWNLMALFRNASALKQLKQVAGRA